jgi:hypothetical protein
MDPTILRNVCQFRPGIKHIIQSFRLHHPAYRSFSTTALRNMKTTEMTEQQLAGVKIDRDRLWRDLHETCEWGKGERWGE